MDIDSKNLATLFTAAGFGAIVSGALKVWGDHRTRVHTVRSAATIIAGEIDAHRFLTKERMLVPAYAEMLKRAENEPDFRFPKISYQDVAFDPMFKTQMELIGSFPDWIVSQLVMYQNYKLTIRVILKNLVEGVGAEEHGVTASQIRAILSIHALADPMGEWLVIALRDFSKRYAHPFRIFRRSVWSGLLRTVTFIRSPKVSFIIWWYAWKRKYVEPFFRG